MPRTSDLPTRPQRRVLALLFEKEVAGQPSLTYREIAAELGWRAAGTVRDHVEALVRKGFLCRSRLARGLRLTDSGRAQFAGAATESPNVLEDTKPLVIEEREAFMLLAPYFRPRRFPAGSILWHKGEHPKLIAAIDKGHVRIFRPLPDGNIASIFVFGPGDLFGFLPFLDGKPYPASAMAIDDVQVRTMSREGLLRALRERPEVIFPMFSYLGRRLRDAFDRIEILSGRGVLSRVAVTLVKMVPGDAADGTAVVHLPMPSGDFARTLGISPESFSRAVTGLAELCVIRRLGRGRFQVLDLTSLKKIGSPNKL